MEKPLRYSAVTAFHKCPKYFELTHLLGEDDGLRKSGDIVFGTAVHMAVEDLFKGDDGIELFDTFWNLQTGLEYGRYGHDELHKMGRALLEIFRDEHFTKFVPKSGVNGALIEVPLKGKIGKHDFTGVADFIGTYRATKHAMPVLALVDWKTSAAPYDMYKIRCNEQIYGYAELAKQALGMDIRHGVYGVAVKDPKNPRWQFRATEISDEKRSAMIANIEKTCDNISGLTSFHKNPSACVIGRRVCPFFNRCFPNKEAADEKA